MPIQRVGYALHRGIETERCRRRGKIVVDRLRHADDSHAVFEHLVRRRQGTVAADANQRAHTQVRQRLLGLIDDRLRNHRLFAKALFRHEAAAVGRADDRAADGHDARRVFQRKNLVIDRREQALVTVNESQYFPTEGMS